MQSFSVSTSPLKSSVNIEIVQQFFEAQYAGDFDRAFRLYVHPAFEWVVSSSNNPDLKSDIPWAGYTHYGKEGYLRLVTLLFSEFETLDFTPHRYTDAGDRVFVEGHFLFRHRTTGKLADSDWLARFDMEAEQITGGQFYENTAGVAAARQAA